MMQFTTATGKYHIASHGNGWAYEVTDQTSGDSLWFQDQDAEFVRSNTDDFADEEAISLMFDVLCD